MADVKLSSSKPKKDRSPSFPFIPLGEAMKRLQAFDATFSRHPAPAGKSGLAWGLKDSSSQAFQILAALKSFGLVRYEGSGKTLHAFLTDDARTFLRAQQDSVKKEVIRRIATRPTQIHKFWGIWGQKRPPDAVCLDQLILQHAFTDSAAKTFLNVYDATIAYAGLSDSDMVTGDTEDDADELNFQVGDLVNWESGGQIQWANPRKIVAIDEKDDQLFYKVQGLGEQADQIGWIPVEQAIQQSASQFGGGGFAPPPPDPTKIEPPVEGTRKEVTSFDEGVATIIWPSELSPASVEDLEHWLSGVLRKARRSAGLPAVQYMPGTLQQRSLIGGAGLSPKDDEAAN